MGIHLFFGFPVARKLQTVMRATQLFVDFDCVMCTFRHSVTAMVCAAHRKHSASSNRLIMYTMHLFREQLAALFIACITLKDILANYSYVSESSCRDFAWIRCVAIHNMNHSLNYTILSI